MLVLLGQFSVSGNGLEKYLSKHHFGRMWSQDTPKFHAATEFCGFDCGAYASWRKGEPFNELKFRRRLDRAIPIMGQYRCRVAVCPDIPANYNGDSLDFSMAWIRQLPDCLPWYLAVQDGMRLHQVACVIDRFSGLFLGGSTEFKATARRWCELAHKNGKEFHYGRCSTVNRVRDAIDMGADSIDSSLPVINWNMGEKKRATAKAWLNTAMGKDSQLTLL